MIGYPGLTVIHFVKVTTRSGSEPCCCAPTTAVKPPAINRLAQVPTRTRRNAARIKTLLFQAPPTDLWRCPTAYSENRSEKGSCEALVACRSFGKRTAARYEHVAQGLGCRRRGRAGLAD